MNAATRFIDARDLLLQHREDLEFAQREFRWPVLEEFNWARDYVDLVAAGNDSCALRVVDDLGNDQALSFAQIAARSHQVAAFLTSLEVGPGDRLLLMLPNCIALWEVMLAAIRAGVVIIPATTLLQEAELRDRIERGGVQVARQSAARNSREFWEDDLQELR